MNNQPNRAANAFIVGFINAGEIVKEIENKNYISVKIWLEHELKHGNLTTADVLSIDNLNADIDCLIPMKLYEIFYQKYFSLFLCNLSRLDTYTGAHTAYPKAVNLFGWVVSYLYSLIIKNNIEVYIHATYPHEIVDVMAYCICKELGIRRMIMPPVFYAQPERFYLIEEFSDYGLWKERDVVDENVHFDISHYGMTSKELKKHTQTGYDLTTALTFSAPFPLGMFNRILNEKYKANLKCLVDKTFDPFTRKYVYMPLHYQPEATIISQADILWDDQILLIERISCMLPSGMVCAIKENPMQTFYYRGEEFFKRLKSLHNVVMVSNKIPSVVLVENCKFVATLLGTAGFEALAREKPVVFTGYALYRELNGAIEYRDDLTFDEIMSVAIKASQLHEQGNQMLQRTYRGIPNPQGPISDTKSNIENVVFAIIDQFKKRPIVRNQSEGIAESVLNSGKFVQFNSRAASLLSKLKIMIKVFVSPVAEIFGKYEKP
jgi:hypothetical protein